MNASDQWSIGYSASSSHLLDCSIQYAKLRLGPSLVAVLKMDHKPKNHRLSNNAWMMAGYQLVGVAPPGHQKGSSIEFCFPTAIGSATESVTQMRASIKDLSCCLSYVKSQLVPVVASFDAKAISLITGLAYSSMWPRINSGDAISEAFPYSWDQIFICVMHFILRILSIVFNSVFRVRMCC